jgi:hypothetical protein
MVNRVGKIHERKKDQDSLNGLVGTIDDYPPHERRSQWNRDVLGHAKNAHARCDPGELRKDVAQIGKGQHDHREESDPHTELFSDEIGQPLSRCHRHSRRHLLNHDQGNRRGNKRPEQGVTVLRSRL